jgi:hypothetical protein
MSKLGDRLLKAAQEGRAIARGEAKASTYRVHVPAEKARETWRSDERIPAATDHFPRRFTRRTK